MGSAYHGRAATGSATAASTVVAARTLHYVESMAALSDDELKALQDKLNAFEPHAVHQALDGIDEHPLRGPDIDTGTVASGPLDFGSVEPGVLIYRLEPGRVRVRITVAEMTGGYYDDIETSDASVRGLVNALVAKLEDDGR